MSPVTYQTGCALSLEAPAQSKRCSKPLDGGGTKKTLVFGLVDGQWIGTIPDHLDEAAGIVGEIKDVAELWGTRQIRAQMEFAQRNGLNYVIHVRPDTQVAQWLLTARKDWAWFDIVWDVVSAE